MDIRELMKQFGMEDDAADEIVQDPRLKKLMSFPGMDTAMEKLSGMMTQGGMMPDDLDGIAEQMSGMTGGFGEMLAGMENLMGGMDMEEIDLDEEVASYDPAAEDAADRAFVAALKAWIRETVEAIPDQDVCMLEIGYHTAFSDAEPDCTFYEVWLAYNTEETARKARENGTDPWNFTNWTDGEFRLLPDEPFAAWRKSQGYDEETDEDMGERVYDLAVVAVTELHRERLTEQCFGKKVPFIIEDFEYYQKTAIRAVKANGGTELFDKAFFADCGFEDN